MMLGFFSKAILNQNYAENYNIFMKGLFNFIIDNPKIASAMLFMTCMKLAEAYSFCYPICLIECKSKLDWTQWNECYRRCCV